MSMCVSREKTIVKPDTSKSLAPLSQVSSRLIYDSQELRGTYRYIRLNAPGLESFLGIGVSCSSRFMERGVECVPYKLSFPTPAPEERGFRLYL